MKKSSSRRRFIRNSGVLLTSAIVPFPLYAMSAIPKYKMGLQLYSIRDAMAENVTTTLKKVRELGYEDLEIYGYDGDNDTYYGYKSKDFRKILEDAGLTTSSGHYGFADYLGRSGSDLMRYVDQCITGALNLDQSYITWPWMAPQYRTLEQFKRLTDTLNAIGERISKAGLGFAYHNHDFEFTDFGGITGYDIILSETDPSLVKLQLDMYWAVHSCKLSVPELIASQAGRFVMWHIKDMDKRTRDYTELGNGSIDYSKILPKAEPISGLEFYYIEQGGNFTVNSMQSIADSADFFKAELQKFL